MYWILEPFSTAPPIDVPTSYMKMCDLLLTRLGCQNDLKVNYFTAATTTNNYGCHCFQQTPYGNKSPATVGTLVMNLIVDKLNSYNLAALPIFDNPVYLSVPMSLVMVLIVGKLGGMAAVFLKLPPII